MAVVVLHARTLTVLGVDEVELYHHLATVADTETQSVGARVEAFDGFLGFFVPKYATRPALGRTENVAVREATAEHYHVHVVECFATRNQVGHVHVLNIESGIIERVSHFAVAVNAFFANNGSLYARRVVLEAGNAQIGSFAGESLRQTYSNGLLLIVVVAIFSAFFAALLDVEQI